MNRSKTKIMKVGETKLPVPIGFSEKQLRFLTLIWPGPIGYGLSIKDAVKLLEIKVSSGYRMISRIRKNFPRVYDLYKSALRVRTKHVRCQYPKTMGFRKDGSDMFNWLEEQSNTDYPSQSVRDFGRILEVF